MKKVVARVLLPMVVVVGVSVAGMRDARGQQGGDSGALCLYENVGFGGQLWPFFSSSFYVGDDVNDRASSVFNATGMAIVLYSEPDFGGFSFCLDPGAGFGDLDVVGLNDVISSFEAVGSC